MRGEVIGIASSQMKNGQNLNFAIPAYLISTMQQASAEKVKELLEPFSEIESFDADTPLWKTLGYQSRMIFESKGNTTLLGIYLLCMDQLYFKNKYKELVQCCD
jgi:hypothetical protein